MILVIGDAIIDVHYFCKVNRLSPEAPVPVCNLQNEVWEIGGAGNVAFQIATKTKCVLFSLGTAKNRELVNARARELKINRKLKTYVLNLENHSFPVKTRVWAHNQQICRIDREEVFSPNKKQEQQIIKSIKDIINRHSIKLIVFSDYNKGTLNDNIINHIAAFAKKKNIITILDPKRPTYYKLKSLSIVTPNDAEIAMTNLDARSISRSMRGTYVLHTRGKEGMVCLKNGKIIYSVGAHQVEVADTCGAGDTVVSFLALTLDMVGYKLSDIILSGAIEAANFAAAETVRHCGCYRLNYEEIDRVLGNVRH